MKKWGIICILIILFAGPLYADPVVYSIDPDYQYAWVLDTPHLVLNLDMWVISDTDADDVLLDWPEPSTEIVFSVCDTHYTISAVDIRHMSAEEVSKMFHLGLFMMGTYIDGPIACEVAKKMLPWWVVK